eukprot:m.80113 g.80113  ORF g.80113 m.80113 type:complete len:144 (+) comp20899_c0_seq7:41-472(+)
MPSIDVPEGYGLVLASALSLVPVAVFYGIITVARARKKYGVKYPTLYATEADTKDYKQFNWAQRAHQNTLEYFAPFLVFLLLAGLKHPYVAAGAGFAWTAGRFWYIRAYAASGPTARGPGFGISILANFVVLGCVGHLAYSLF